MVSADGILGELSVDSEQKCIYNDINLWQPRGLKWKAGNREDIEQVQTLCGLRQKIL